MFPSVQVFHMYVVSVSSECCKTRFLCCICLQWLFKYYPCHTRVLDVCFECFSCFGHVLQVFYLDITKIVLVLHMLQMRPTCHKGPAAAACWGSDVCHRDAFVERIHRQAHGFPRMKWSCRGGACVCARSGAGAA
jgi:hypothetical protein